MDTGSLTADPKSAEGAKIVTHEREIGPYPTIIFRTNAWKKFRKDTESYLTYFDF